MRRGGAADLVVLAVYVPEEYIVRHDAGTVEDIHHGLVVPRFQNLTRSQRTKVSHMRERGQGRAYLVCWCSVTCLFCYSPWLPCKLLFKPACMASSALWLVGKEHVKAEKVL